MDAMHSEGPENAQSDQNAQAEKQTANNVERFIRITFEKLPARTKVLVALFSALNTATTLTKDFELPDHLWSSMRFEDCGPLVGESEEVNWLKGVCDGIFMVANYT